MPTQPFVKTTSGKSASPCISISAIPVIILALLLLPAQFQLVTGVVPGDWLITLDRQFGGQLSRYPNAHLKLREPGFKSVFRCPSYVRLTTNIFSYGYNCDGVAIPMHPTPTAFWGELGLAGGRGYLSGDWRNAATKENEIINPAQMIAVGDAAGSVAISPNQLHGDPDLSYGILGGRTLYDGTTKPWFEKRHDHRWNILFCDSHVEMLKPQQMFDNKQDSVRRLWNKDNQPHREYPSFGQ